MAINSKYFVAVVCGVICTMAGCSSAPSQQTQKNEPIELSANSPTVLNARIEPDIVVLNSEMQPTTPAQIVADVKDFKNRVTDVRLKFADVPLEIPMENIGGTTWRAQLTPQELQMLAVSGKTVKYKTMIVAKSSAGDVSDSGDPVLVAVKAPLKATYG
jgi:hypothetical protein